MITSTARQLHRLPTWVYLVIVFLMLIIGTLFMTATALAYIPYGGKIVAVVPRPFGPFDPCGSFTPASIYIAGAFPSPMPCGLTWSLMPTPPVGFWFIGKGTPFSIFRGGIGP